MRKFAALGAVLSFGFVLLMMATARAEGLLNTAPLPVVPAETPADPMASALKGFYGEASVGGNFLASGTREANFGVGLGFDIPIANQFIVGARTRIDRSETDWASSIGGRVGFLLNRNFTVYAAIDWGQIDWKLKDGVLFGSIGGETTIGERMTIFVEAGEAVSKGKAGLFERDDIQVRSGLRLKVGP